MDYLEGVLARSHYASIQNQKKRIHYMIVCFYENTVMSLYDIYFLAGFFLAAGFLAAGFLAAGFLAAGFLAAGFLAAGFLAAGFLAAGFLAAVLRTTFFAPPAISAMMLS
jgi:anti-sigma factor RsiW